MISGSSSGTQSPDSGIEEGESPPHGALSEKRKPKWIQDTLEEAQGSVGNPRQAVRESKPLERFCNYLALVSNIREVEPSTFEEATIQHVWKDAMMEEYSSIMKMMFGRWF
jgi:hypothetical protein